MKRKMVLVIMAFGIWGLPSGVWSANVDTYGIGAEATAMGGAITGYVEGALSLHYNPAGLTKRDGTWIVLGSQFVDPKLDVSVEDPNGLDTTATGDTQDKSPTLIVPMLGVSYRPSGSKFGFGFGAYVPFGLHLKWDRETSVTRYSVYESWIQRFAYGPGIAYQISDTLSCGAAFLIGKSEFGEKKFFRTYAAQLGGYVDLAELEVEGNSGTDFSANIGFAYQPSSSLSIGLTYRSQADVEFDGDLEVEYTEIAQMIAQMNGFTLPAQQKTSMKMKDFSWPQQLQAGLAYKPVEALTVTFDLTWTDWSVVQTTTPELEDIFYLYLFRPDIQDKTRLEVHRKWEDAIQTRIGGEYRITEQYAVRAGYYHDPSPIKDKYFDVSWPDAEKHVFAIGGGAKFGSVGVDAAYQYSYIPKARDIGPNESENLMLAYPGERLIGKTTSNIQNFVLSISYGF